MEPDNLDLMPQKKFIFEPKGRFLNKHGLLCLSVLCHHPYLSLGSLGQRVDLQLNTVHVQEHLVQILDLNRKEYQNLALINKPILFEDKKTYPCASFGWTNGL